MLECIKFILQYTAKFCAMLFTIDIGSGMSLGLLLAILFIFLPVVLRVLTYIKHDVVGELDEMYDEGRPRESIVMTKNTTYNPQTGVIRRTGTTRHSLSQIRKRRYF